MSHYFVIADAHGNGALVDGLLTQEFLPQDEVTVIQLGDLANCVLSSEHDDMDALKLVGDGIDMMLLGNHESPHLGDPIPFFGFHPHPSVKHRLQQIKNEGRMALSVLANGVLLTHAGLSSYWGRKFHSVMEAHNWLGQLWAQDIWTHHPIVTAIGSRRGGLSNEGGILWSDWSEPKRNVPQLFGHTVGKEIRIKGNSTCIDLGAGKSADRIAGAWIDEDGGIRVVTYTREQTFFA